jgi:uncharacterized protein YoxC
MAGHDPSAIALAQALEALQALGNVEGSVNELRQGIQSLTSEVRVRDGEARQGRRELHTKMDNVNANVQQLQAKVDPLIETMSKDIKPKVEDYWSIRQRAQGGIAVAGFILATMFAAVGFLARDAWHWIVSHFH